MVLVATHAVPFPTRAFLYDFRAFYCGASVAASGHDPYLAEPLRTCEHAIGVPFRQDLAQLAVPVPLPGYALLLLAPLARLPFAFAGGLWTLLELVALVVSAETIAAVSGLQRRTVWSALLLSVGFTSAVLGQLVPFAVAALGLAARELVLDRPERAAAWAVCAMIEPHIGLPACLALAVWTARARPVLASAAVILSIASLAFLGVARNLEYIVQVLPAHVLSEVANEEQYSLAYLVHLAGLNSQTAALAGNLSYVAAVAGGVALSGQLYRRGYSAALLVTVPAAIALIGGPFLHIQQVAVAIPAAAIIAGTTNSKMARVALVLLAVPWGEFAELLVFAPIVVLVAGVLVGDLFAAPVRTSLLAGLCAAAALILPFFDLVPRPDAAAAIEQVAGATQLAEATWRAFIEASYHQNEGTFLLAKLPTFAALLSLLLASWQVAQRGALRNDTPAPG